MASPAVVGRNLTNGTTATSSPVVNIGSPANGTRVVVLFRVGAGVAGPVWPAGWNELVDSTDDASDDWTSIAYRDCDGAEGATITLTTAVQKFAAIALEITGQDTGIAPELSTVATGTSTTPDPTTCTPTGGAKDYLWIWAGGWEGEQTSPPASNPTNYTDPQGADSGTAAATATNVRVATAERLLNAASEDPGSWTISASDDWTAWTIAIHPSSGAAAVLPPRPTVVSFAATRASTY